MNGPSRGPWLPSSNTNNKAQVAISRRVGALPGPPVRPDAKAQLLRALAKFDGALKDGSRGKALSVRFNNLRTRRAPDSTDVLAVAEEISNDCARRHGGWREYAMRAVPILERIRQFAPIGDVITGGAQDMIVSGVWGALRLALEVR